MLGIIDSLIRGLYAGLEQVYTMLFDAYNQVKEGKWPDFTGSVPFPSAPTPLPAKTDDMPSWFETSWNIVRYSLNLLATKNSQIATILPSIEVAGDELVESLLEYFPPSYQNKIPDFPSFPSLPAMKLTGTPGS